MAEGDSLAIIASGTNPGPKGTVEADDITVQPGGGQAQTTSSIMFGGSVSDLGVGPSSVVAGTSTLYVVDFTASDAIKAGGSITVDEPATDFSRVSGVEVTDVAQGWQSVASGATLAKGSATIPISSAVSAGDAISVLLGDVTNPPAGTIDDLTVATTGDPVPATADAYVIVPKETPGVTVTVAPPTPSATATYTLSNLRASAALPGGSGTIKLEGPSGTQFPSKGSDYSIFDFTSPAGSGIVSGAASGGGTNSVTLTVPHTISSGDFLAVTVGDVANPGTAGSYSITAGGNVNASNEAGATGPWAKGPRTAGHHPVVTDLTTNASVVDNSVALKLACAVAACKGTVDLASGQVFIGGTSFNISAGKTALVHVPLSPEGRALVRAAKHHTINVRALITVTGGQPVKQATTLVG
ncbi:MAG TPA: hypothetical protein VK425_13380 [Acidimicrobiales bacterium]|nr:hypothetical protein [Acidimicrobiales bacterium]